MILASMDNKEESIDVRVESNRIDVKNFALSREHNKDRVNAVQLFSIAQIFLVQYLIQDVHQIGEKLQINAVRESVKVNC